MHTTDLVRPIRKHVAAGIELTYIGDAVCAYAQSWDIKEDGKPRTIVTDDGRCFDVGTRRGRPAYTRSARRPLALALSRLAARNGALYVTSTTFEVQTPYGRLQRQWHTDQHVETWLHLDGTCAMQAPTQLRLSVHGITRVLDIGDTLNSYSGDVTHRVSIAGQSVRAEVPTWRDVHAAAYALGKAPTFGASFICHCVPPQV